MAVSSPVWHRVTPGMIAAFADARQRDDPMPDTPSPSREAHIHSMTATNPLLADWTTPFALPPFDLIRAAWSADPAGAALLTRAPRHGTQGRVAAGAARTDRVRGLVREWLSGIREAADTESVALLVVLRVLAGELPLDPREQTRVRGVLGQLAVRTLVETSLADLLARVDAVLNADAAAFTTLLADADDAAATAERLRSAVSTGATE